MSAKVSAKSRRRQNPELRRRRNMAAFWQERYNKAADSGELAAIAFDRARAAALRAESEGRPVMYELAQMLSEWAERIERAETGGHAS